ncbi:hypothetical protein P171DRAFT_12916 [Karstenula rhodostoma CBS 690.94]|uniref:Uncharacterized protein n=1 Tax=Karstenula rhodostoma CBS 690.94 TaxID=1392251 RepID=A0A9P4PZ33_9PLEO|nr:hypothetical protein P171DRAFT_12916 [Karstenula rhodostoma CBS 690.94]
MDRQEKGAVVPSMGCSVGVPCTRSNYSASRTETLAAQRRGRTRTDGRQQGPGSRQDSRRGSAVCRVGDEEETGRGGGQAEGVPSHTGDWRRRTPDAASERRRATKLALELQLQLEPEPARRDGRPGIWGVGKRQRAQNKAPSSPWDGAMCTPALGWPAPPLPVVGTAHWPPMLQDAQKESCGAVQVPKRVRDGYGCGHWKATRCSSPRASVQAFHGSSVEHAGGGVHVCTVHCAPPSCRDEGVDEVLRCRQRQPPPPPPAPESLSMQPLAFWQHEDNLYRS